MRAVPCFMVGGRYVVGVLDVVLGGCGVLWQWGGDQSSCLRFLCSVGAALGDDPVVGYGGLTADLLAGSCQGVVVWVWWVLCSVVGDSLWQDLVQFLWGVGE